MNVCESGSGAFFIFGGGGGGERLCLVSVVLSFSLRLHVLM